MNPVFDRAGLTLIERGWLSSNNVLFHRHEGADAVLVDSGYQSHAAQTVELVRSLLGGQQLDRIVNTHLHSDHCGGNHVLQQVFGCAIDVPRGEAEIVDAWDESRLSFKLTGQNCSRFQRTGCIDAGAVITLGGRPWQVTAAPGHDPVAVIFYQPDLKLLISADALWQNGFGVVFPELDGVEAFSDVRRTLDRIAELDVAWVIPGHGAAFDDVQAALQRAYRRLDGIVQNPEWHAWHAAKVLVKFHLMEVWQQPDQALWAWMNQTPLLGIIQERYFDGEEWNLWCQRVIAELCLGGALRMTTGIVHDSE